MDLMIKGDRCANAQPILRSAHASQYPVFGLIGVLGVLAFIFSVVSPTDDSVQQECVQGSKNRHGIAESFKWIPYIRGTLVGANPCAIVLRSLGSFWGSAVGSVRIFDVKVDAPIFFSRIADRSPPSKSF